MTPWCNLRQVPCSCYILMACTLTRQYGMTLKPGCRKSRRVELSCSTTPLYGSGGSVFGSIGRNCANAILPIWSFRNPMAWAYYKSASRWTRRCLGCVPAAPSNRRCLTTFGRWVNPCWNVIVPVSKQNASSFSTAKSRHIKPGNYNKARPFRKKTRHWDSCAASSLRHKTNVLRP